MTEVGRKKKLGWIDSNVKKLKHIVFLGLKFDPHPSDSMRLIIMTLKAKS